MKKRTIVLMLAFTLAIGGVFAGKISKNKFNVDGYQKVGSSCNNTSTSVECHVDPTQSCSLATISRFTISCGTLAQGN